MPSLARDRLCYTEGKAHNKNMDKRHLHHLWTKLRAVKPWYFLLLLVVLVALSTAALRSNYQHMSRLRTAVYTADQNNGNTVLALQNLQAYVTAHMNTNLAVQGGVYPPIQLKYTYDRLIQAESAQAAQEDAQNTQVYSDAEVYCQAKIPNGFSGSYRISCIQDYIASHGITNPLAIKQIPDSLYKFDFASPRWSPDLAGWSIVAAVISAVAFVLSWISQRWLRRAAN